MNEPIPVSKPKYLRGQKVEWTRGDKTRIVMYLDRINASTCTIINESGRIETAHYFELRPHEQTQEDSKPRIA